MEKAKAILIMFLFIFIWTNLASALNINSIITDEISPGKTGNIIIQLNNDFNDEVTDVSINLNLKELPFTPIGSSADFIKRIKEDDEEKFTFKIKSDNNINPGDYKIPYLIKYKINNEEKQDSGTIGLTLKANAELSYSISQNNQIINEKDRIIFKITNKGFGNAKFVSVKLIPNSKEYLIRSDSESYIGKIDSDDFETTNFDIILKKENPIITAIIEYTDFDNEKIIKTVNIPLKAYTKEKAIELGIIKKDNKTLYTLIIISLIIIFFIYRTIKKRIRSKKENQK